MKALRPRIEPLLEPAPTCSLRQKQNAEAKLAENDRIDGDLALVGAEPLEAALVWRQLGRLAQDVRVD